jgi:hypothetical protein
MFCTCGINILDTLSFSVKFHHYNFFCLSITFIRIWPQLLIEKKFETYYKFVNMNGIALQNLIPTLENCSQSCDYFDPLFIKQIKK